MRWKVFDILAQISPQALLAAYGPLSFRKLDGTTFVSQHRGDTEELERKF